MRRLPPRQLAAVIVVILLVVVAISLYLVRGASQSSASSGMAPAFSGPPLAGKTVSLDQFEGKPLLLVYMTDT